jgi:hypothetical protein
MHVKEAMELFAKQFPQTALLVVSLFGKEIPEQFEIMPSSSIGVMTLYGGVCERLEFVTDALEELLIELPLSAKIDLFFFSKNPEVVGDFWVEKYGQKYALVAKFVQSLYR